MTPKKGPVSSVIVLCTVCLIASLMVSLLYLATGEKIEENRLLKAESLRRELLPAADSFEEATDVNVTDGVLSVYRALNGAGWVITSTANGYKGNVTVMTSIDENGKIVKVKVTDVSEETDGIGTKLTQSSYLNQYAGASSISTSSGKTNTAYIESVTGATYTSEAVFSCVSLALLQYQQYEEGGEY